MNKSPSSSFSPSPSPLPISISHLPLKTRISISLFSRVTGFSARSDGTINRRLLKLFDFRARPNPKPIHGVSSSDITVDRSRNLWFRVFIPHDTDTTNTTNNNTRRPIVIFFHGGGFTYLSASSSAYDAVCRRFAGTLPAVVLSVEYRLSPEHRFPCQYDDGFDVLMYLNQNPKVLPPNSDLTKTFLAGDSAGANLAHHVAVRTCQHEPKLNNLKLVGVVSIQPFFGGEERTESEIRLKGMPFVSTERTDRAWKLFLPEGEDRDHWAVNVSGPNAVDISKFGKFPAFMVVTGGLDALRDRQIRYYEWLKRSGKEAVLVDYPNTIHAFYVFPELSESSQLIMEVKNFVSKHLRMSEESSLIC